MTARIHGVRDTAGLVTAAIEPNLDRHLRIIGRPRRHPDVEEETMFCCKTKKLLLIHLPGDRLTSPQIVVLFQRRSFRIGDKQVLTQLHRGQNTSQNMAWVLDI